MAAVEKTELSVPAGRVRIGISGWRYKGWRGVFYPEKLPQRSELRFASGRFTSIEINGTFYSLQRPSSFLRWAAETPDDFTFAIKGARFITHMRKLREVETPLANFFAQGVLALGAKLGPVLWQFPPQLHFDPERFASFFRLLPRTTAEAATLAAEHDPRLRGRAWLEPGKTLPIRHCVEIRHESFATPEWIELLREHNIGQVVADTVAWPLLMDVTSDFVYVRLHGSEQLYASGYEADAIEAWADRIVYWATGAGGCEGRYAHSSAAAGCARDVYVYFDNDVKVRAPFDAEALQRSVSDKMPRP